MSEDPLVDHCVTMQEVRQVKDPLGELIAEAKKFRGLIEDKKCCAEQPDGDRIRHLMARVASDPQGGVEHLKAIHEGMSVLELQNEDAEHHAHDPSYTRAGRRLPSLGITLAVELFVALVISNYFATLNRFQLLIAVQPVISAISGNIGLQSSSINVRGISSGFASNVCSSICKEIEAGLWLSMACAVVVGGIAGVWYVLASDPSTTGPNDDVPHSASMFAVAVAIGQFCAGLSACISGASAPLLFKALRFDPANLAGPLETAFQDIIGSSVLLAFSSWFLDITGAGPQCPHYNWTSCEAECHSNTTFMKIFGQIRDCDSACDTFC